MADDKVRFVKGHAFAFDPMEGGGPTDWMVSNIIAAPQRCTQLLDTWCKNRWAQHMVVTMKFQGGEPDLEEVHRAMRIVEGHGYSCHAKHFFINKNEITLMLSERDHRGASNAMERLVGSDSAMYLIVP